MRSEYRCTFLYCVCRKCPGAIPSVLQPSTEPTCNNTIITSIFIAKIMIRRLFRHAAFFLTLITGVLGRWLCKEMPRSQAGNRSLRSKSQDVDEMDREHLGLSQVVPMCLRRLGDDSTFFSFFFDSQNGKGKVNVCSISGSRVKNNKNVCYLFHWIKSECRLYTAKMTLQDEKRENSGRQLNGEDKAASLQVVDRLQRPWDICHISS